MLTTETMTRIAKEVVFGRHHGPDTEEERIFRERVTREVNQIEARAHLVDLPAK